MEYIDRLKEYVEEDIIYKAYCLADLGKANEYNDFEKYSIQHCQDIKRILNYCKKLENNLKEEREAIETAVSYINVLTEIVKEQKIDEDKDKYILERLYGIKEILIEREKYVDNSR